MPKLHKILVPVDYSESSRIALEYAVFLGGKVGALVRALHVLEVPPHVGKNTIVKTNHGEQKLSEMLRDEAVSNSEKFVAEFAPAAGKLECELVEGHPAKTILKVADEQGFDMIVMGTHGRTGLARLIMGSVAEQVVRTAKCPVVTVCKPEE